MAGQYLDWRACADVPMDVTKEHSIGQMIDVYNCLSTIDWFVEVDGDMKVLVYEPPTISFDRGEKISNLPIKQTVANANSMEIPMDIELEFNYNHPFIQRLASIIKNEHYTGDRGKGLIALSNGGIWFQEKIIYNKGKENEFVSSLTWPHLKISEMTMPLSGIVTSDTNYVISLLAETWPIVEEKGNAPAGYGLPKSVTPPIFSNVAYGTGELTFDFEDTDSVVYTNDDGDIKLFVEVYDKLTDELITTIVDYATVTTTSATLPLDLEVGEYIIRMGYFISETLRVYAGETEISIVTLKGAKKNKEELE